MEAAVLAQLSDSGYTIEKELVAFGRQAYSLALRLTGSPEDAEDVVQQSYLNACRSFRSGQAPMEARTWFLKVVANEAKKHLRDSERRARRVAAVRDMGQASSSGPDPEMLSALRSALEVLDPESRALVSLCCEHGCSQSEAADILGIPARTASFRLRAGLERLRTALAAAGFSAAPAVVLGSLQQTAPSLPSGLAAKIEHLVFGHVQAAGAGAGSGAVSAAPGGGMAMKMVAGVLVAGLFAGSAAVVNQMLAPPDVPLPPTVAAAAKGGEKAAGGPTVEHLAWCPAESMYLDGPALEAMSPVRAGCGVSDDDGNVWFGCNSLGPYPGARCVVKGSGLVWLTFGDDYWNSDFGLAEGPASAFINYGQAEGFQQAPVTSFVFGSPMEGGDKGCLYFTDGRTVKRVWRNQEKGGRWWFKTVISGGGKSGPHSKGQSAPALEAGFYIKCVQVMPDGRLIVFGDGGFFEYKEKEGTLVCLLGFDDYKANGPRNKKGESEVPTQGIMGGDGAFYVGTYFSGSGYSGAGVAVWRIGADGKVEAYVQNRGKGDGPGLWTGYFCGPHIWPSMHNYKYIPADCIFLMAHDDAWARRVRNGRVATLCPDGEWRELDAYGKGLRRFRWWAPGPNGTATAVDDTVSKFLAFRVSGIDYDKAVVGPPFEPPEMASGQDKPGK